MTSSTTSSQAYVSSDEVLKDSSSVIARELGKPLYPHLANVPEGALMPILFAGITIGYASNLVLGKVFKNLTNTSISYELADACLVYIQPVLTDFPEIPECPTHFDALIVEHTQGLLIGITNGVVTWRENQFELLNSIQTEEGRRNVTN